MAHSEDRESVSGQIEPYHGGPTADDLVPYVPRSRYDAPSYLDLHPIEDGPIQEKWAKIITPYRATLHFRLFMTERWYRVAIAIFVLAMIAVFFLVA